MGQGISHAVEKFNRVFSKRFLEPESGYSTHAIYPRLCLMLQHSGAIF
jgi:hypothetical protein